MIIYVLEHMGGFSHLLTLRLLKHREEKAILAVVSGGRLPHFLPKLVSNGLFDYVFEYKNCGLQEVNEQETINALTVEYDNLLKKHGINIKTIRLGYVFYDTLVCFSLYLYNKNVDIITVEIEPDYIWKTHDRYLIMQKKHLFASSIYYDCVFKILPTRPNHEAIKKVIVYPETEMEDNDFVERYDFISLFLQVKAEDRHKVLQCFRNDLGAINDDGISLLLPNSIGWLNYNAKYYAYQTEIAQYFYDQSKFNFLYAVICDYFYDKHYRLVTHPHPDGKIDSSIFEKDNSIHIDDEMPIEFLLYIQGLKIQEVLAIETSSTNKMKSMIKTDRSLGKPFISCFHYMDKLYVIQKVVNVSIKDSTVFYYGIPDKTFVSLYNCNFYDHNKKEFVKINKLQSFVGMNYYIINNSWLEHEPMTSKHLLLKLLNDASTESVVFFINSLQDYCFADLNNFELMDNIVPVIIQRKPVRDTPLCETYDQVVYVFSKSKRIHELLKTISFTKQLPFSGVEIIVSPVSATQIEAERRKCIDFAVGLASVQGVENNRFK